MHASSRVLCSRPDYKGRGGKHMDEILLVDDNKELLWLVRILLEQEGLAVRCAESGEEALSKLRTMSFRLMITDLDLPGVDGFSLSRIASKIVPCMPVIMITGSIAPGIPEQAERAGITKIIAKPFHLREIMAAIRDIEGSGCIS